MVEAMPNGDRPIGSRSTSSLVMLLLTCVSQFVISRRMHSIRAEGALTQSEVLDPRRGEFDILHRLSTATEGVVFLLGLGAIFIESRRD
jgi:hypothetical protein